MDEGLGRVLIARYVLNTDRTLQDSTNETMDELRTGHRPFGPQDKNGCKIIAFVTYVNNKNKKR